MNMKSRFLIALSSIVTSVSYADQSKPAATLTAFVKKGTCSLPKDNWCPTSVEDTKNGFILHALTAQPFESISLNYRNLDVPCLIWKTAGGQANAVATLAIANSSGEIFQMSRLCK
jgi:hypothetical protein